MTLLITANFRSIRGSLSREVSLSPEEEVVSRERKRSVKFKETSDLNLAAVEEMETQDVNHVIKNGGGEEENIITVGNGNIGGSKEETAVTVNGASDSSGA